jgi:hypothetical protein
MMQKHEYDDAGTPSWPVLLLALLGAPVVWALYFSVAYALVAIDCGTSWANSRFVIAIVTIVAMAMTLGCGFLARRVWIRARTIDRATDDSWTARMGERTARVSFLMVSGLLLSVLFTVAVAYAGVPLFFLPTCPAAVTT